MCRELDLRSTGPLGAKYDGAVHVVKATAAGASLWEQCVVTKLDKDGDGSIHTVHFLKERCWT